MRYKLDSNGYILAVFWGGYSVDCKEYTGTIPSGYSNLNDWSENALINAYYIDNEGNLALDSEREAELQEKAILEAIDNTPLVAKDLYGSNEILDSQYEKQMATGTILNLSNVKNISPKVKITGIDYLEYESLKLYSHSRNMIKNDGKTETINGVDFTKLADGSIKINGTATADIEYNLSGSSTNAIPIFVLKRAESYYLNIGGYSCEMKYYNEGTTAQVYTGADGLISLSEDKEVTQVILKIPKGKANDTVIKPMLNYGITPQEYEAYKSKVLEINFGEPFSSDALYPSDELYPSDDLFPTGTLFATDYILIENGIVYVNRNNVLKILGAGNVQLFNGNTTLYSDKDVFIEIEYSIDVLSVEERLNTRITKTEESIMLEASKTYTTKAETSTAKQEAIDSANASTDDKLKNYSTTTEMESAITLEADSIRSEVNKQIGAIEIEPITNKVEGIKTITLAESIENDLLELHVYGNNEVFKYLYPANDLLPKDTLYPYGDSRIVVTNEDGTSETYELGVLEVLRQNNAVCDEYVLKQGKAKVIRRIAKDGTILKNETIEELGEYAIKLKKGTNTITIKNYEANISVKYAIQSDYSETFPTKIEMNSSITQTANEINLKVEEKLDEEVFTGANIMLAINNDTSTATINADKINLNGKEINLTSDDVNIKSDFLDVSKDGKMTLTGDTNFDPYNPQIEDYVFKVVSETHDNLRTTIQPDVVRLGNDSANVNIQVGTIRYPNSNTSNVIVSSKEKYVYISSDKSEASIQLASWDDPTYTETLIKDTSIRTPVLTQTSREEQKKNFEKLESGLDIINNTEIYKYNLKSQADGEKKHIGFVIGENYKYSSEITALDNEGKEVGVDTYSMISVAYKAIQEQQELIKQLQEKIKELEGK